MFHRCLLCFIVLLWVQVVRAADPLDNWHSVLSGPNAARGLAFGNGTFVSIGPDGNFLVSPDGATWVSYFSGTNVRSVDLSFQNNEFVAVGPAGILISSNGMSWQMRTSPVGFDSIAHANGVWLAKADLNVWRSIDFTNWTTVASTVGNQVVAGPSSFVVTGGPDRAVATVDGSEFQFIVSLWSVSYANGLFIGTPNDPSGLLISPGGFSWQTNSAPNNLWASRVVYGNGVYVLSSTASLSPGIMSSTNLIDWKFRLSTPQDQNYSAWSDVAYGKGVFVVVYYSQTNSIIFRSDPLGPSAVSILQQPSNRIVNFGEPVTLRVVASGTDPVQFQWLHGDQVITNATNSSYTIAHAQATDAGKYQVRVTNPLNSVLSTAVSLEVIWTRINLYAGVTIEGNPGAEYRIDYRTDLSATTNWLTLTNFVLPQSPFIWIDYESPGQMKRFYRPVLLPQ